MVAKRVRWGRSRTPPRRRSIDWLPARMVTSVGRSSPATSRQSSRACTLSASAAGVPRVPLTLELVEGEEVGGTLHAHADVAFHRAGGSQLDEGGVVIRRDGPHPADPGAGRGGGLGGDHAVDGDPTLHAAEVTLDQGLPKRPILDDHVAPAGRDLGPPHEVAQHETGAGCRGAAHLAQQLVDLGGVEPLADVGQREGVDAGVGACAQVVRVGPVDQRESVVELAGPWPRCRLEVGGHPLGRVVRVGAGEHVVHEVVVSHGTLTRTCSISRRKCRAKLEFSTC